MSASIYDSKGNTGSAGSGSSGNKSTGNADIDKLLTNLPVMLGDIVFKTTVITLFPAVLAKIKTTAPEQYYAAKGRLQDYRKHLADSLKMLDAEIEKL